MLPPSTVSILLAQGTFLFLSAHPGLSFRLPFRFRSRPAVNYEVLRYQNDIPLVFAFCNADKIRTLLSQSSMSAQSALTEVVNNEIEQKLINSPTSESRGQRDGNEIIAARPNEEKKPIPVSVPVPNTQLAADVPAKPPPAVTTTTKFGNNSELEHGGGPGGSPESSTAAPPRTTLAPSVSSRKRRGLADLASTALELAKVGPSVQGDMAGTALEVAGSVAGERVRAVAAGGGRALAAAGPVGRLTASGLAAAGSLAGRALEAAGAGGGAVLRTLGSAADSVAGLLGVG